MAKQQRVWWYPFSFAGRRVQESSKSTRKTVALKAEKNRRLELERGYAGMPSETPAQRIRTVSVVLREYAANYSVNHRKNSIVMVKNRGAHLERILGRLPLSDISAQRIVTYMQERLAKEDAGGRTINFEIQILASAMGYTWKTLWPRVMKLEENHDVGRALEQAEEQAIMDAATRNQSRLIYPFLFTLAWTGVRSDEGRTLRWTQMDMDGDEITVGGSKSAARKGRKIPMTGNLKAVLLQHAAWITSKLGAIQSEWYVFPRSNRLMPIDPLRPVTSLKDCMGERSRGGKRGLSTT